MPTSTKLPKLKYSNNAMAEMLVKALGVRSAGVGSWSTGIAAEREELERLGIDVAGLSTATGTFKRAHGSGGEGSMGVPVAGGFDIDETWRWGFDVERSTDDTYLRRYGFNSEDTLTSHLFVEGFRGRNYAALNAYSFQGLRRNDDPGETPLIAPIADAAFLVLPVRRNAFFGAPVHLLGPDLDLEREAVLTDD